MKKNSSTDEQLNEIDSKKVIKLLGYYRCDELCSKGQEFARRSRKQECFRSKPSKVLDFRRHGPNDDEWSTLLSISNLIWLFAQ